MGDNLKELFEKKQELIAKADEKRQEIEKLVKKELDNFYLEEEWTGFQDKRQSDEWQVYIENEEFILYYQFGQIDFKKLLRLHEIFKKQEFELYSITDSCSRHNASEGIFFYFRKEKLFE